MTFFTNRIAAQPGNMAAHAGAHLTPLKNQPGTLPVPPQDMSMPLTVVSVTGDGVSVREAQPLVTADGAMVPATGPGQWQQLHAAGRG